VTDDGSRPLPEPIDLGNGRRLISLRDVEIHLVTLTPAQRTLRSRRLVERAATEAARGGDIREVLVAVKLARILVVSQFEF
jgi:hypothetical protein